MLLSHISLPTIY